MGVVLFLSFYGGSSPHPLYKPYVLISLYLQDHWEVVRNNEQQIIDCVIALCQTYWELVCCRWRISQSENCVQTDRGLMCARTINLLSTVSKHCVQTGRGLIYGTITINCCRPCQSTVSLQMAHYAQKRLICCRPRRRSKHCVQTYRGLIMRNSNQFVVDRVEPPCPNLLRTF